MNLFAVADKLAANDHPPITLDAQRCVRGHDKLSTCELCVRVCPVAALRVAEPIALDVQACVACGLCVRVCPAGAFAGDNGTADVLNCLKHLPDASVIELACARHPAPAKGEAGNATVIRTNGCLAAFGASAYLRILAQSPRQLIARLDACAECPIGRVQPDIRRALDSAQALFAERITMVLDKPGAKASTRTVYDAKSPPVSRRDFFRMFTGESIKTAALALAPESLETPTSRALPLERRHLIAALKQLAPAEPTTWQNVSAQDLGATRLRADEKCTACGVCARVCPTGAMQFSATGETYRLSCSVAQCTDCGVCLDVCEPGALHRDGVPTFAELLASEPVSLRAGALKKCAKCGAAFADHIAGNLCPICDFRRRNLFGSWKPRTREARA